MPVLYVDPVLDNDSLRAALYAGNLVVRTELSAAHELAALMRDSLADLFAPRLPEEVHEELDPPELAALLATWKPAFIHDPKANALVRQLIEEVGFAPDSTHYDVPKPRTSYPVGHLTTGIAFAFPWHRDTWYSAPVQQINWWMPVFDVTPENAMVFDLGSFDRPVPNTSNGFDYYQVNVARRTTASQVGVETQSRPSAVDHTPDHGLVVVPRVGSVLLFSGAQLHASIPNTSGRARYSIDFRTVDRTDVETGRGAPAVDVHCSGTALRDFLNVHDGNAFDEALVRRIYGDPPADAVLTFQPGSSS